MPIIDEADLASNKTKDSVVFAFGRFQPPTIGHAAVIQKVKDLAHRDADHYIVPSASYNYKKNKPKKFVNAQTAYTSVDIQVDGSSKENPLPLNVKLRYLNALFKDTNFFNIESANMNNLLQVINVFKTIGYTSITLVVGSDRVKAFSTLLEKYHGDVHVNGDLKRTTSASATQIEAMSGTKMRLAAVRGNLTKFMAGIPVNEHGEQLAISLMRDVRYGLGIDDDESSLFPDYNGIHGVYQEQEQEGGIKKLKGVKGLKAFRAFKRFKATAAAKKSKVYILRSDEKPKGYRQPDVPKN